jgi:integrase
VTAGCSEAFGLYFIRTAIRLLLLTGARRNEILTLRWEHVDLESGLLKLPDSKTGPKSVPLGPAAVALLAALPRVEGNPYVVPGRQPGDRFKGLHRPWVDLALAHFLSRHTRGKLPPRR